MKDGLNNDISFILSVLVTFVAPPGCPNMTTPHQFPIEIHSFMKKAPTLSDHDSVKNMGPIFTPLGGKTDCSVLDSIEWFVGGK